MMLRTHTQTGGSTCTAQQPENNIVRGTLQALAAVLGGVQSLALSCFDEAIAIPTDHAQQIALRTQQIIAHESGVPSVADPLGGSYYVEALTQQLYERAKAEIARIDAMGGAIVAVERGYYQRAIADASYAWQREVESGARVIVGVNEFTQTVSKDKAVVQQLPEVSGEQTERLRRLRQTRNTAEVESRLAALQTAASGDAELFAPILEAVRARATIGEICGVLRGVWGEHVEHAEI